jgi:site-specific recombinase XerD
MSSLDDASVGKRLHVTPDEVDKLRKAVRLGRNGHRDETMIYMGYRHGLRCGELVRLKWTQILWEEEDIQIVRSKLRGKRLESDLHNLDNWEMKALRAIQRAQKTERGWIFRSERKDGKRGGRMTERGFHQIIARAGVKAGLSIPAHPHMLRHGCGYRMNAEGRNARSIQAWLGHRDISTTQMYCAMSADHFRREGF